MGVSTTTAVVETALISVNAAAATQSISSFVHKDDVTKAEIMWTLKAVMSHYSYNSASDINILLQSMFPDSKIAKKFQLGSTKMTYIIKFGLSPHCHTELMAEIRECDRYVVAFDESLNKITQHGPLHWLRVSWPCIG